MNTQVNQNHTHAATQHHVSTPNHIISLASSCILIAVKNSVWTGTISDKKERNELASAKQADAAVIDVSKKLLAKCPEHKALLNLRQTISNMIKTETVPWMGDIDCLPMVRHDRFMRRFGELEQEHIRLKSDFAGIYQDYISDLAFGVSNSMGQMFNRNDYPALETVLNKFTLSLQKFPVPMNDFRVQVSHDLADDLTKHYNRETERVVHNILDAQVEAFLDLMATVVRSCGYEEKVNKKGQTVIARNRFVESTWLKLLEMVDTYRSFNPTQSAALETLRSEIEQIVNLVPGQSIEVLRDNDVLRAKVGVQMEAVLNKFRMGVQPEGGVGAGA